MNSTEEIAAVEAELADLKQQLTSQLSEQERHDIQQRIIAKEYQLTELYKQNTLPVAPAAVATVSLTSEVITTNHPRKRRWEQLNACIAKKAKLSREGISANAYTSIKYTDIEEIYDPLSLNYVQSISEIPETEIALLTQILEKTNDCIGRLIPGKDAKRLLFISPILVIVCSLFKGDVQILVEQDLIGKEVKANGHFEFILKRDNKRICIVLAKKEDMEQALAQNLIGCEMAADLYNSTVVYGIITTYIQWAFLKSGVDKIEIDETMLAVEEGHVNVDSLKKMLADENM